MKKNKRKDEPKNTYNLKTLAPIYHSGVLVVTTEILAGLYGVSAKKITNNLSYNKSFYQEGLHYFKLKGKELSDFIERTRNSGSWNGSLSPKMMLLWPKRGCFRIARHFQTPKALEVYDLMETHYFEGEKSEENIRQRVIKELKESLKEEVRQELTPAIYAELERKFKTDFPREQNPLSQNNFPHIDKSFFDELEKYKELTQDLLSVKATWNKHFGIDPFSAQTTPSPTPTAKTFSFSSTDTVSNAYNFIKKIIKNAGEKGISFSLLTRKIQWKYSEEEKDETIRKLISDHEIEKKTNKVGKGFTFYPVTA